MPETISDLRTDIDRIEQTHGDELDAHDTRITAAQTDANNAQARADAAHARITETDIDLKAYADTSVADLRQQITTNIDTISSDLSAEMGTEVGNQVSVILPDVNATIDAGVQEIVNNRTLIDQAKADMDAAVEDVLDNVTPLLTQAQEQINLDLPNLDSTLNTFLTDFPHASVQQGFDEVTTSIGDVSSNIQNNYLTAAETNAAIAVVDERLTTTLGSTSSASLYATQAEAHKDDAESAASAASAAKLAAEAARDTAQTEAAASISAKNTAVASANDAGEHAAAAQSSQELAAQTVAKGSGVLPSQFLEDGWVHHYGTPTVSANEIHPQGNTFLWDYDAADGTTGSYLKSNSASWNGPENADAYAIDLEFTLISGSCDAAGILFDWRSTNPANNNRAQVRLVDMVDGPIVQGEVMSGTVVLVRPDPYIGTFSYQNIWFMTNSSTLGSLTTGSLKLHRFNVRPATAEERGEGILAARLTSDYLTASNTNAAVALAKQELTAERIKIGLDDDLTDHSYWVTNLINDVDVVLGQNPIVEGSTNVTHEVVPDEGNVLQVSTANNPVWCGERHFRSFVPSQKWRVSVRGRVSTNVSGIPRVRFYISTVDSNGTYVAYTNIDDQNVPVNGWADWTVDFDPTQTAAYTNNNVTKWRLVLLVGNNSPLGDVFQISHIKLEDITATANIEQHSSVVADLQGNAAASYALRVGAGGEEAGLEIVAANDVVNGSASQIRMHANNVLIEGSVDAQHLSVGLSGANLLKNTDFLQGTLHWHHNGSGTIHTESLFQVRPDGSTYRAENYPTLELRQSGTSVDGFSQILAVAQNPDGTVKTGGFANCATLATAGNWYMFSAYLAMVRTDGEMLLKWYDEDGVIIGTPDKLSISENSSSSTNPENWARYHFKAQAPTGTAYVQTGFRKFGTKSNTSSFVFIHKPMLEHATEQQKTPSAYSDGSATIIDGGNIFTENLVVTGDMIASNVVSNFAFLNHNKNVTSATYSPLITIYVPEGCYIKFYARTEWQAKLGAGVAEVTGQYSATTSNYTDMFTDNCTTDRDDMNMHITYVDLSEGTWNFRLKYNPDTGDFDQISQMIVEVLRK